MLITDATSLPRLMNCNGSRLMQADIRFAEHDDTIRNEGNAAHWLASVVFAGKHTTAELIDRKAPNGVYITADMAEHVDDYLSPTYSTDEMEWAHSFNGVNWQINGRADLISYRGLINELEVTDFKYGYTVIEPEKNWTLIAHALGFCVTHNVTPDRIIFTIHQPRAPHRLGRVRSWEIGYQELLSLYAEIDRTLSNPSNMLQTGTHCYKCPAFLSCPARQAAEINAIEAAQVAYKSDIDNEELAFRLDQIARAKSLLVQSEKAYLELGTYRVTKGEIIENYAVENELTNRVWKDFVTPEMMEAFSVLPVTKKPEMISPRQAEQSGLHPAIVTAFTERREKGRKLVRIDAGKKGNKLFGAK